MPVTLHPAPHNAFSPFSKQEPSETSEDLLKSAISPRLGSQVKEVFQSSFDNNLDIASRVFASPNSFVHTAVDAYSNHHHLVIRPDDVWLAILTQFSFFACARAEELRHCFVPHEEKLTLTVKGVGNRYTVDSGEMAHQMEIELEKNVVDPELRTWIIPDFTTTETNDEIIASVVMMATTKEYFDYKFSLFCGLPAVTLLGEKEDWVKLLARIEKLKTFGKETTDWHNALKPVLSRFVDSFDKPNDSEIIDFWQRISHHHGGGSDPTYLTGWITAFCFFTELGKNLHYSEDSKQLPAEDQVQSWYEGSESQAVLRLDGVLYHRLDTSDIPLGYVAVDVMLDDNGEEFQTIMVAGSVGTRVSDTGIRSSREEDILPSTVKIGAHSINAISFAGNLDNAEEEMVVERVHDGRNDVVQPVSGWWIFHKRELAEELNQLGFGTTM